MGVEIHPREYFALIERINRLDIDRCDYNELVSLCHGLTNGLAIEIMTAPVHELYFRVRRNSGVRPLRIKDLGPPPEDCVTGFQRCNPPNRSMFYTCSKRGTAILEARSKPGEVVYLSQWQGRHQLPVNIALQPHKQKLVRSDESIPQAMFHAYLDTMFTQRIHVDFSNDYKKSAAITEVLTSAFGPDDKLSVRADGRVGLRYPSIFDYEGSYNTVFPSTFVGDRIFPIHVIEAKIQSISDNRVDIDVLDTAVDFDGERILWTGNPAAIPVPYEGWGIRLRSNGKKWLVDVRSAPPTPDELTAFLEEDLRWGVLPVPGRPLDRDITQQTALMPFRKPVRGQRGP